MSANVPQDLLERCARSARYVGSVEHKTYKSFAGEPKLRSDATPCPTHLNDPEELTEWLRAALRAGHVGEPFLEGCPRYVWVQQDDQWFEGMLTNQTQGWYKGYPITDDQAPKGLL